MTFVAKEADIRVHRVAVIAPNKDLFDAAYRSVDFFSHTGHGAVLVQTHHGTEAFPLQIRRIAHGDVGIRVTRIAHHQYTNIARRHFI